MAKSLGQFTFQLRLIGKFVKTVFPIVDSELEKWEQMGGSCPDDVLATQALASIKSKKFHCQGGSVYALHPAAHDSHTSFIVALQTISDYLDNLCDRVGFEEEKSFRQLHYAMLDAVDPVRKKADYYAHYPHQDDGGYLESLVDRCRSYLSCLPSYGLVKEDVLELTKLYCDLQTYKHLPIDVRDEYMEKWINSHLHKYEGILPYEFAAATGSTLGIFMLTALAANLKLSKHEAVAIKRAYFPWVCGLHILLDYYIDQEEDKIEGDLNFIFYYDKPEQSEQRLKLFVNNSINAVSNLPQSDFHMTVVQGLLAMYLSDPKTRNGAIKASTDNILGSAGKRTRLFYRMCRILRATGKL